MKTLFSVLGTLAFMAVLMISCDRNESGDDARLRLYLTDAPGQFEEVNVDIAGVEVIIDGTRIELDVEGGVVNLLELTNGRQTLLADQPVPAGTLSQVRLILGENNSVKVDGGVHSLVTPSAQQSGLKFNVHRDFVPEFAYDYIIDFDAARSIVKTGSAKYILKPVIRVFSEVASGAIKGNVFPPEAKTLIHAISAADDTSSTRADSVSGDYVLRGLPEGFYTLKFIPDTHRYDDTATIENVEVVTGIITVPDTVKFEVLP